VLLGEVFSASHRSASLISPACGFIKQVEDLLFGGARARDIEEILIGEFYYEWQRRLD